MRKSLVKILLILSTFMTVEAAKISNDLENHLSLYSTAKVWIYFADKGPDENRLLAKPEELITDRALIRRLKVRPADQLVDQYDLPVYEPYIDQITRHLGRIHVKSHWLNAISADVGKGELEQLLEYGFIDRLDLVHQYRRPLPESVPLSPAEEGALYKSTDLDYGTSFTQLAQINVHLLHERGISGEGILVCLLDNGFAGFRSHASLDSLDVMATWDFINNDEEVDEYPGTHGTQTLSAIAAYDPGALVGPAYKAAYMLGKTEIVNQEIQIEEDHWVAGLEWAERNGADIVSSSLGYIDWYTWEDLDGETPLTTRHADMAVERGLLVVNSAGNEAKLGTPNTLIAPADGKYVLTVGAVDQNNNRSSFSSYGPTSDGRTKPDVMAMGTLVKLASAGTRDSYVRGNGTSFACPLVAGVAAQLLSAFPDLTPAELINGLRNTASQSSTPDNFYGWGIVNAEEAYTHFANEHGGPSPEDIALKQNYPNPFNGFTVVTYEVPSPSQVRVDLYDIRGRKVMALENRFVNSTGTRIVDAADLASGIYIYRIIGRELSTGKKFTASKKMIIAK